MMRGRKWQENEDLFLKKNCDCMSRKELAKRLDRPILATQARLYKLGLIKKSPIYWNETEINFIRENYYYMSAREIAKKLKRSLDGTTAKLQSLGIKKAVPENVVKEVIRLANETNFTIDAIHSQTHVSEYQLRKIFRQFNIKRKPQKNGWKQLPLLYGFHYKGHNNGKTRYQLLYAYRNTCYDCKRTFVNERDLHIHHDFTKLPVQVLVLCRNCHLKRHKDSVTVS